jgi:crossover junction endodeoxyribonuclease RusA
VVDKPLEFVVHGQPVPKGRPRFGVGRAFTPKRTREWETWVRRAASAAIHFDHPRREWPTKANVNLELGFWFADARRRDIDNAAKAILDAGNGVLWVDDSQVCRLLVTRAIDRSEPRATVKVCIL